MLDKDTQIYYFTVLYDDVLSTKLSLKRNSRWLTFGDINRSPLRLPSLVFPFKRALYFMAYHAYDKAVHSRRAHLCLGAPLTEDDWTEIRKATGSDLGMMNYDSEDSGEDDADVSTSAQPAPKRART
jgi:hypothetical protein